jgi:F-type H+-transporting ATPase subunit b
LIVKRFLFKPIKDVITKRNEEIERSYADAETALTSANESKLLYESKLSSSKAEAEEIIRSANEKASKLQKELIEEAKAKAESAIARADEQIALEKKKAENEIRTQIAEVSVVIAEQLIDREINEKDHEKLINDMIDNVKR